MRDLVWLDGARGIGTLGFGTPCHRDGRDASPPGPERPILPDVERRGRATLCETATDRTANPTVRATGRAGGLAPDKVGRFEAEARSVAEDAPARFVRRRSSAARVGRRPDAARLDSWPGIRHKPPLSAISARGPGASLHAPASRRLSHA